MTFDPMAKGVDWLDSYRSGDLEGLLKMYAEDAVIECGCRGLKILQGREALRAYWIDRLAHNPARELDDIGLAGDEILISYTAASGATLALLELDNDGQIKALRCRPNVAP